jgi:hypothetical protein
MLLGTHVTNILLEKNISGGQFEYDRALEIIQDKQYLEDLDFDKIRGYAIANVDILKKIGKFDPNFNTLSVSGGL